jgi:hypothetical protein
MRLTLAITLFILSIHPAHAYLDPGTGSIIIQSLIAAIAAGAIVTKTYWYRVKTFFSKSAADNEINMEGADNKDPSE